MNESPLEDAGYELKAARQEAVAWVSELLYSLNGTPIPGDPHYDLENFPFCSLKATMLARGIVDWTKAKEEDIDVDYESTALLVMYEPVLQGFLAVASWRLCKDKNILATVELAPRAHELRAVQDESSGYVTADIILELLRYSLTYEDDVLIGAREVIDVNGAEGWVLRATTKRGAMIPKEYHHDRPIRADSPIEEADDLI